MSLIKSKTISALFLGACLLLACAGPGAFAQQDDQDTEKPEKYFYFTPRAEWVLDENGHAVNVKVTVETNLPKGSVFSYYVSGGDIEWLGLISRMAYELEKTDNIRRVMEIPKIRGGMAPFVGVPILIPEGITTFEMTDSENQKPGTIIPTEYTVTVKYEDTQEEEVNQLVGDNIKRKARRLKLVWKDKDGFPPFAESVRRRFQADLRKLDKLSRQCAALYDSYCSGGTTGMRMAKAVSDFEAEVESTIKASRDIPDTPVCLLTNHYHDMIDRFARQTLMATLLQGVRREIDASDPAIGANPGHHKELEGYFDQVLQALPAIYDHFGLAPESAERVQTDLQSLLAFLREFKDALSQHATDSDSDFSAWVESFQSQHQPMLINLAETAPAHSRAQAHEIVQIYLTFASTLSQSTQWDEIEGTVQELTDLIEQYMSALEQK